MDLSTPASAYAMLTGVTCNAPEVGGEQYIVQDRFVDALEGDAQRPSTGEYDLLMPPDQRLTESEIELVRAWVRAGAPCD